MRWKQARERKGITQAELARLIGVPGVDKSYISKMENGLFVPPPKVFRKALEVLECAPQGICGPGELDYGFDREKPKKAVATREKPDYRVITFRMPREPAIGLPRKAQALGYNSLSDYLARCVERLNGEYEKLQEDRNNGFFQDMQGLRRET